MLALHKNKGAALVETGAKVKFLGAETFGWVHVVAGDHGLPMDLGGSAVKPALSTFSPSTFSSHISMKLGISA